MDVTKQIVARIGGVIAMTFLLFASSANAQCDRTAVAYDRLEVMGEPGPELKRSPDLVAESFFRMLAHTPAVDSKPVAPRTDADPLHEAVVRVLWNTSLAT